LTSSGFCIVYDTLVYLAWVYNLKVKLNFTSTARRGLGRLWPCPVLLAVPKVYQHIVHCCAVLIWLLKGKYLNLQQWPSVCVHTKRVTDNKSAYTQLLLRLLQEHSQRSCKPCMSFTCTQQISLLQEAKLILVCCYANAVITEVAYMSNDHLYKSKDKYVIGVVLNCYWDCINIIPHSVDHNDLHIIQLYCFCQS